MKTMNRTTVSAPRVLSNLKAGALNANHNATLRVRSNVVAGSLNPNHNQNTQLR